MNDNILKCYVKLYFIEWNEVYVDGMMKHSYSNNVNKNDLKCIERT